MRSAMSWLLIPPVSQEVDAKTLCEGEEWGLGLRSTGLGLRVPGRNRAGEARAEVTLKLIWWWRTVVRHEICQCSQTEKWIWGRTQEVPTPRKEIQHNPEPQYLRLNLLLHNIAHWIPLSKEPQPERSTGHRFSFSLCEKLDQGCGDSKQLHLWSWCSAPSPWARAVPAGLQTPLLLAFL